MRKGKRVHVERLGCAGGTACCSGWFTCAGVGAAVLWGTSGWSGDDGGEGIEGAAACSLPAIGMFCSPSSSADVPK